MSENDEFRYLYEEIRVFRRNLTKDSQVRRQSLEVAKQKLLDLDCIKEELDRLKLDFNKESHSQDVITQAKSYVKEIEVKIKESQEILTERLSQISEPSVSNIQHTANMPEKFDLKTAASLLPSMNGSEDSTKQLIDCIELYSNLLDDEGKKMLITYVLKSRVLSQSAKLRLGKAYASVDLLIEDMKCHLLTKQSAAALASQLHGVKQKHQSIEEYGKTIEQLLVNLTLTQANGDDNAEKILTKVNEKIAVNTFANGLKSNELRTILKARNYDNLRDAICCATEEEASVGCSQTQVFHMKGRNNYNRKNWKNNNFHNKRATSSFVCNRRKQNNNNNNYPRNHSMQYKVNSSQGQGRPFTNNIKNKHFAYHADSGKVNSNDNLHSSETKFFRASTE